MSKPNLVPKPVEDMAAALSSLPGIGPKLANRIAIYLAVRGKGQINSLTSGLVSLERDVQECRNCRNLTSNSDTCLICLDVDRDKTKVLVVETPLDLVQIERTEKFRGLYFVVGALLSPLNGIGPKDIGIDLLEERIAKDLVDEVIFGLGSSVESEATALFISEQLSKKYPEVKFTRLAQGLSAGVSLEYVDTNSLSDAITHRTSLL